MELRDYQKNGLSAIREKWEHGKRRVLAVAPTGAGKGTMACAALAQVAAEGKRGLFIAHRREIVLKVLDEEFPRFSSARTAAILPGRKRDLSAPIQFASIQTLLAGKAWPSFDYVIPDECHHYVCDEYRRINDMFPLARMLGLTATTNRSDGRAMREVFDDMVVVATYSKLLASGHIVPCRVLRPNKNLGMDLAQHPVTAYEKYANGDAALVYVLRVEDAVELAEQFNAAGHVAAAITESTPRAERDLTVQRFRDGGITVLVNVYTLTEGVDIPRATTAILGRRCENEITYLQLAGRILRTYNDDKRQATLIDLTGASIEHGNPTIDREYSLDGRTRTTREPVDRERGDVREPKVLGVDLYTEDGDPVVQDDGANPKRERWNELKKEIEADNMSVDAAHAQYRREFGENCPWVAGVPRSYSIRDVRKQVENLATDAARAYL